MSDIKPQILTEGHAISAGVSPKPTINKPSVKPAGQGTINPQNKGK